MLAGKLTEILNLLDAGEWKALRLFLASPYFNQGKDARPICRLIDFCHSFLGNFNDPSCSKENAYKNIYPDQAMVKGKLEKLMTRSVRLVEAFLVQRHREAQPSLPAWQALSEFYRKRNKSKLLESTLRKSSRALLKDAASHADRYWQQFLLNREWAIYYSQKRQQKTGDHLLKAMQSLDLFYLVKKMEHVCWLYTQKIHKQIEQDDSVVWMEGIAPFIAQSNYFEEPAIEIYFLAYQLLKKYNDATAADFLGLEAILKNKGAFLSAENLKSLHTILRIYAVGKYNHGDASYLPAAFRLYQEHLDKGWLYYEQKLLPESFMNIVKLGLRLHEKKWVYAFLMKYKNKIWSQQDTTEIYHFNLSTYYFHCKEFEKAENLINQTYQNFYYKSGAKRLEMMILYEQKSDLLLSKSEAFKMFVFRLSKQQMPDKLKHLNNHFIDFLRQLMHPKTLGNVPRINRIIQKLNEKELVAEREWLMQKLHEMK